DRGILQTASGRGYRLLGSWTVRWNSGPSEAGALEPRGTSGRTFLTNLPVATSDLIGRTTATEQLRDLLLAYPVVTLGGPGGIGKTALALDVARRLLPSFPDGAWAVEFASLADPGLVASAVAKVLHLKLGGAQISPESVAQAIKGKKLLILLDNCEHVV